MCQSGCQRLQIKILDRIIYWKIICLIICVHLFSHTHTAVEMHFVVVVLACWGSKKVHFIPKEFHLSVLNLCSRFILCFRFTNVTRNRKAGPSFKWTVFINIFFKKEKLVFLILKNSSFLYYYQCYYQQQSWNSDFFYILVCFKCSLLFPLFGFSDSSSLIPHLMRG